jgi:hypothetical protein
MVPKSFRNYSKGNTVNLMLEDVLSGMKNVDRREPKIKSRL